MVERNYLNLRQSIITNLVQYFNELFHWKKKSFFMSSELNKGVHYRFIKKERFFLK